ncbi:unnamed protein product [Bursaphelenchus xylophilus]|uniref:(pine wood nematode) hypothetical protein n=1 Tax=Bursaphelenchus xylophilus TaxID=6326 RepID=A0A1I7RUJ4_BURXY|nr:unnamed protein product [Bursaphelenchus xylophilus]CAG9114169.1 unnamed protein product [Bursaphelenchus xylophilus]
MMTSSIQLVSSLLILAIVSSQEPTYYQKLQELFQKSDLNRDAYLERSELGVFVRHAITVAFPPSQLDGDTIETAVILADTMFDEADSNNLGQLSFKGSMLFRSPANIFGDKVINMLVDLIMQVDSLEDDESRINSSF